ncbi:Uncharacterised protein [Mycobacterium tuberculosis]|nr:Uncharacterised protein [Mycobacterium tuberculosis]COZ25801.1 Uncharacterised protein [Mycobacterium tuberculosis]
MCRTGTDDAAEQHNFLQDSVEHQPLEGNQGDLPIAAQQEFA